MTKTIETKKQNPHRTAVDNPCLCASRSQQSEDLDVVWQDKLSISRHIYERGSIVVFRYTHLSTYSNQEMPATIILASILCY